MLAIHVLWLGLYLRNGADESRVAHLGSGSLIALAIAIAAYLLSNGGDMLSGVALGVAIMAFAQLPAAILHLRRTSDSSASPYGAMYVVMVLAIAGICAIAILGGESIKSKAVDLLIPPVAAVFAGFGLFASRRLAEDRGEAYLPDVFRSYDYSMLIALLFGGQVALAMWSGPGATRPMIALLIGTITAAITIQVYLDRVQGLLDRIAFAKVPWLRVERAELRQVEHLLPRVNMTDPLKIDEQEFSRLTRRALGNYGDLTKLATSPLTNLPEVHRRLAERRVEASTLERARELKVILAEAIAQLKPRTSGADHGTTDEWRFYNALYYPYIVGMRPYSSTVAHHYDDPANLDVLDWFLTYVPERTLYNWQNAAAALIAGHLREQEQLASTPARDVSPELSTAN